MSNTLPGVYLYTNKTLHNIYYTNVSCWTFFKENIFFEQNFSFLAGGNFASFHEKERDVSSGMLPFLTIVAHGIQNIDGNDRQFDFTDPGICFNIYMTDFKRVYRGRVTVISNPYVTFIWKDYSRTILLIVDHNTLGS